MNRPQLLAIVAQLLAGNNSKCVWGFRRWELRNSGRREGWGSYCRWDVGHLAAGRGFLVTGRAGVAGSWKGKILTARRAGAAGCWIEQILAAGVFGQPTAAAAAGRLAAIRCGWLLAGSSRSFIRAGSHSGAH
ncbi:hypothetical protein AAC387_Pa12g0520 [Persea americana]